MAPKLPSRRCREHQREELRVRSVERADEDEVATAWVDLEAKVGFTVRK